MNPTRRRIRDAALRLFVEHGSTRVTIQELAQAAGVARGTVYRHVPAPEHLFAEIAAELTREMNERVLADLNSESDPARRLYRGMEAFLRRAHEEPAWGRFLVRFAISEPSLQGLWTGAPARELSVGAAHSRFQIRPEQAPTLVAMIAGSLLAAMLLVLEGHQTWRAAASELGQLVLRGVGLDDEAIEAVRRD